MSAVARQELAAAASAVQGVQVTPHYRQTGKPGEGYVRRDVTNADETGFGYMVAWQVCVFLPGDLTAAGKRLDDLVPALCAALSDEGVVTSAEPVQIPLDQGSTPALIVTVIRAQE